MALSLVAGLRHPEGEENEEEENIRRKGMEVTSLAHRQYVNRTQQPKGIGGDSYCSRGNQGQLKTGWLNHQ